MSFSVYFLSSPQTPAGNADCAESPSLQQQQGSDEERRLWLAAEHPTHPTLYNKAGVPADSIQGGGDSSAAAAPQTGAWLWFWCREGLCRLQTLPQLRDTNNTELLADLTAAVKVKERCSVVAWTSTDSNQQLLGHIPLLFLWGWIQKTRWPSEHVILPNWAKHTWELRNVVWVFSEKQRSH